MVGEIGPQRGTALSQQTEESLEFLSDSTWPSLGGSQSAARYLQQMDEGPMLLSTPSCSDSAKKEAVKICAKHLGNLENASGYKGQFFQDCVFDVCNGGEELDAELSAEILEA